MMMPTGSVHSALLSSCQIPQDRSLAKRVASGKFSVWFSWFSSFWLCRQSDLILDSHKPNVVKPSPPAIWTRSPCNPRTQTPRTPEGISSHPQAASTLDDHAEFRESPDLYCTNLG